MNYPDLLKQRYGATPAFTGDAHAVTNPTLETLAAHRSVRRYLPRPLAPGMLEAVVASAQSASTSSNLQLWSVVALEDTVRKEQAAVLCGDQDSIRQAPVFLIFCADLDRPTRASRMSDLPGEGLAYLEMFIMANVDAALAAQNATTAAESLGLGTCYIGGARNQPHDLATLLHLPTRVFALFGLTVGWPDPDHPADIKPRLPQAEVLHRETWHHDLENQNLTDYEQTLTAFDQGQEREPTPWTVRSARRVATQKSLTGRHVLRQFLQEHGFELR